MICWIVSILFLIYTFHIIKKLFLPNIAKWDPDFFVITEICFSNSLIIHRVKTKKIISVKEIWIPGLNYHRFWRFYFSVYSLDFVSIEEIYQTLETVFHRLSKHLEFRQKYSAARRIFNSLLGVSKTKT